MKISTFYIVLITIIFIQVNIELDIGVFLSQGCVLCLST